MDVRRLHDFPVAPQPFLALSVRAAAAGRIGELDAVVLRSTHTTELIAAETLTGQGAEPAGGTRQVRW